MPNLNSLKNIAVWIIVALLLVAFFNLLQQPGHVLGQYHDLTQIFINWFPMLLLIGVWIFFLTGSRTGKWTYVSPEQMEQTETLKSIAKTLERIEKALEERRF